VTTKAHKKHADITKPQGGKIHRNEYGLLGAPCGVIQKLTSQLAQTMNEFKIGYADAAHGSEEDASVFHANYIDKIKFNQVSFQDPNMEYSFRMHFNGCDAVLVNSNHFKADQQLVLINQIKKESLERKLDRLTQVRAFILDQGEEDIHDFLKTVIPEAAKIPVFPIEDVEGIAQFLKKELQDRKPKIKGLVLTGGKSTRMGEDKSMISYRGMPQKEFIAAELDKVCDEVYFSVRAAANHETSYPELVDSFANLGPYGGILSAFRYDPNAAWLVVATDIPYLEQKHFDELLEQRNPAKMATAFHNPETNFPEPLITLWEPSAYQRLLYFLSLGYSCPRKALINSEIEEIQPREPDVLFNANTPEEKTQVLEKLNG
jgi:molybdopterin-guanine dinucleotide biosynthesis protein A